MAQRYIDDYWVSPLFLSACPAANFMIGAFGLTLMVAFWVWRAADAVGQTLLTQPVFWIVLSESFPVIVF